MAGKQGGRQDPTGGAAEAPLAALLRLVNGFQVSQAISVAATLGIADLLKDGARSSDDLAGATGTHPRSLYRLLRALASVGVLQELAGHRFALTPMGECLRSDSPQPVGPWAAFIGAPPLWQAWGNLLHSIRTGENAFRYTHGTDPWTFRARDAAAGALFDRAMTALSTSVAQGVLDAFDFGPFACIVDVGGGHGALLAAILTAYPAAGGILFDQPHVVAGAQAVLCAAGVADRCRIVGGSFFEAVPGGGDAYVLKSIIHDWEDEPSIAILRQCRRAMGDQGRLLVIERELLPPNEGPETKFSDLNMLVGPMGQERTTDEYAALYAPAGFRLLHVHRAAGGWCVFEGIPV